MQRACQLLAADATSCQDEISPISSQPEVAMLTIPQALHRIKGRLTQTIPQELIEDLCRQVGHRWRNRDLGKKGTGTFILTRFLSDHFLRQQ